MHSSRDLHGGMSAHNATQRHGPPKKKSDRIVNAALSKLKDSKKQPKKQVVDEDQ